MSLTKLTHNHKNYPQKCFIDMRLIYTKSKLMLVVINIDKRKPIKTSDERNDVQSQECCTANEDDGYPSQQASKLSSPKMHTSIVISLCQF